MAEAQWGIIDILLPALLLAVLLWLVTRRRSSKTTKRTEDATRDLYSDEDKRRREGTDDL
ncbi:MAG: hypothetical protein ABIS38_05590 [Sphingomicrobium sp.]